MIISNLYQEILKEPVVQEGCDELFVVSGYASATFVRRHLEELSNSNLKVNLIIGMPGARNDHEAYLDLHDEFEESFKGYYLDSSPPVHAKAYSWFKSGDPLKGYAGSANYSQPGFLGDKQINQMAPESPQEIKNFYDDLLERSVFMPDANINLSSALRIPKITGSINPGSIKWIERGVAVRISLLDSNGQVPSRSGLNWGQREGREKNQAYLSIKGEARMEGFLPEKGFRFTLVTDDEESMDCVVAQDGRKSVQTTKNNSILGSYFRKRLGLEPGAFVRVEDLERYGRTDFTLVKLDEENFQLDFAPPQT